MKVTDKLSQIPKKIKNVISGKYKKVKVFKIIIRKWRKYPDFKYYHRSSIALLIFLSVISLFFSVAQCNNFIKVAGLFFQVSGIWITFKVLAEKMKLFGEISIWGSIRNYLNFLFRKTEVSGSITNAPQIVKAKLEAQRIPIGDPEKSIDGVILWVKRIYNSIEEQNTQRYLELSESTHSKSNELKEDIKSVNKDLNTHKGSIKQAHIKSAPKEFFGILVLVLGLILSAIPEIWGFLMHWFN